MLNPAMQSLSLHRPFAVFFTKGRKGNTKSAKETQGQARAKKTLQQSKNCAKKHSLRHEERRECNVAIASRVHKDGKDKVERKKISKRAQKNKHKINIEE